jgi:hypothetical protein
LRGLNSFQGLHDSYVLPLQLYGQLAHVGNELVVEPPGVAVIYSSL